MVEATPDKPVVHLPVGSKDLCERIYETLVRDVSTSCERFYNDEIDEISLVQELKQLLEVMSFVSADGTIRKALESAELAMLHTILLKDGT